MGTYGWKYNLREILAGIHERHMNKDLDYLAIVIETMLNNWDSRGTANEEIVKERDELLQQLGAVFEILEDNGLVILGSSVAESVQRLLDERDRLYDEIDKSVKERDELLRVRAELENERDELQDIIAEQMVENGELNRKIEFLDEKI